MVILQEKETNPLFNCRQWSRCCLTLWS